MNIAQIPSIVWKIKFICNQAMFVFYWNLDQAAKDERNFLFSDLILL